LDLLVAESRNDKEVQLLIQYLITPKVAVQSILPSGATLLHVAIQLNDIGSARVLLENGADVNAKDNNGNLAIHLTSRYLATKLLARSGSLVNTFSQLGTTALHRAISLRKHKTVRVLLKYGAKTDVVDSLFCKSQFQLAVESEDPKLVLVVSSKRPISPLQEETVTELNY